MAATHPEKKRTPWLNGGRITSMVAYKQSIVVAGLRWKDKQARTVMRVYMKEMVNNRAIRSKS